MKNDEIVMTTDIVEFSQRMREERLAFVRALLDECALLRKRIDQEKRATGAADPGEFVWFDGGPANQAMPANDCADRLNEWTTALSNLSNIDYILNDVATLIGEDKIAYGRTL